MAGPHRYEKVSEDGDEDAANQPMLKSGQPATPAPKKKLIVWLYVLIIILVGAVFTLGSMVVRDRAALRTSPRNTSTASSNCDGLGKSTEDTADIELPFTEIKDCGSNADEARALGCVFDVMMQEWTSPECYDSALTERYLASNNWTWYADSSGERTMSDEEIRLGNHLVVFAIQDYHKHHCVFTWEKLVRAMRADSPVIDKLISYDHVAHCEHQTLFNTKDVRGVSAPTGFSRCAPFEVWKKTLLKNKLETPH